MEKVKSLFYDLLFWIWNRIYFYIPIGVLTLFGIIVAVLWTLFFLYVYNMVGGIK